MAGSALPRRSRQRTQQRLGQAERAEQVGGERRLEVLALGVGQRHQRDGPERRSVVDENFDAASAAVICSASGWIAVLSETSAAMPCVPGRRSATALTRCASRATKATWAPAAFNWSTNARPRPEVPPVTATRRPRSD